MKFFVLIDAVETNVPPPNIVGLVPASNIDEKFLLTSRISDAPEIGDLSVALKDWNCPNCGIAIGFPIAVVAAEAFPGNIQVGCNPIPETEAPETLK